MLFQLIKILHLDIFYRSVGTKFLCRFNIMNVLRKVGTGLCGNVVQIKARIFTKCPKDINVGVV